MTQKMLALDIAARRLVEMTDPDSVELNSIMDMLPQQCNLMQLLNTCSELHTYAEEYGLAMRMAATKNFEEIKYTDPEFFMRLPSGYVDQLAKNLGFTYRPVVFDHHALEELADETICPILCEDDMEL